MWQYADTLARRGVSAESGADAATVRVLDSSTTTWQCRFAAAQHWSTDRLLTLATSPAMAHLPKVLQLSTTDTAMLSAMLVGDRTLLDRSLRTAFERTGSFHLFVVAGVHVGLLVAALYWLLLRLRVPRWPAAAVALAITAVYAVMTGFGAPVQRALLMSAVYLFALLMGRNRSALNALGAAALAMLVLHPHALFESGFQMTVLAVVAIAGIAVPLTERTLMPYLRALHDIQAVRNDPHLPPRLAQFRVSLRWLGEELSQRPVRSKGGKRITPDPLIKLPAFCVRALLSVSELVAITLLAEMVLALPMAVYFHRATPFAAPANLLALPMIGLLMGFAIATFAASLIHPLLAAIPAAVTGAAAAQHHVDHWLHQFAARCGCPHSNTAAALHRGSSIALVRDSLSCANSRAQGRLVCGISSAARPLAHPLAEASGAPFRTTLNSPRSMLAKAIPCWSHRPRVRRC